MINKSSFILAGLLSTYSYHMLMAVLHFIYFPLSSSHIIVFRAWVYASDG